MVVVVRELPLRPFLLVEVDDFSSFSSLESTVPVVGVSESEVLALLYSFGLHKMSVMHLVISKQDHPLIRSLTASPLPIPGSAAGARNLSFYLTFFQCTLKLENGFIIGCIAGIHC